MRQKTRTAASKGRLGARRRLPPHHPPNHTLQPPRPPPPGAHAAPNRNQAVQVQNPRCVNAARELLCRYIRFRCANHIAFCCRGVNFSAFTASLGLLPAHVGRWDHGANDDDAGFLVHQRPSEHALVDEAFDFLMERMDGMEADGPGGGDLQLEGALGHRGGRCCSSGNPASSC
ncbi:hypothetical protein CDEST_10455 [Colletotrichum destructivum]|uniref:Uncharacterized protein n=1 Tax=Colletotrichum destructivum TaxID=34406 RepID=A0AAX4IQD4_9PEZI|nr:hypothetical protein CDEST_10455 [Colletotrichum destructivum]